MPPTREGPGRTSVLDQQQAAELVRRKAAELEAVFESLGDGLLVVSSNAHIVEANRAMVALMGFGHKDQLLGPIAAGLNARVVRTDGGSFGSEDLGLRRTLRDGSTERGECVLRREYGGPRWIETVISPIRTDDGTILGASIVARDMTHQRRRERDLSLVVSVTDALMSAVDVPAALAGMADRCVHDLADWCAVYQLDPGTETLRLAAMRQHDGRLGGELADLLARRPARIGEGFAGAAIRADATLSLFALNDASIRRHAGTGVEAQIARRLGLRAIVAAPFKGNDGPLGVCCVGWTNTARGAEDEDVRLVEELARRVSLTLEQARCLRSLEEALDSLELVLDSMDAGLLILGSDGRAILVNETVRAMIGLRGAGIGSTLADLVARAHESFDDPRELDDFVARTAEHSVDAQGSFRLGVPAPMDVEWLARPVRDERGAILGQVIVWVDVTHIRAAERVKDDLAADLSEALRAPLQAISTHAVQALRRGRRVNGDQNLLHGLEVILRNARQISMHVNDLVDAARFDAATLSLDLIEVDIHDVVQQAVDQARAMTTTHRFKVDVPPALPPPRWDPDRIRQALLHVLSNSIKYWPDGGQINVKVRPQLEGVVISIRDRGIGVPPEEHERIFERFFRLSADPSHRRIRGNGLGLYLVRGVVEAHAGTVWVESSGVPGEGTTVHMLLPWLPGAPVNR